ncbi:MAG: gamma-glutamyltransferase [Rhodospirillales bacterium]|nr:gamma-glutamyltransferase [Rhodospirillales bacterium]
MAVRRKMRKEPYKVWCRAYKASVGLRRRQFTLLAVVAAVLAGCGKATPVSGTVGSLAGFVGAVAADEPQAALIGRQTLLSGGTAADAAVAMYFSMAVTLPSKASLGGGGRCITFSPRTNETSVLDFLARPSSPPPAGADRPTAVPGNIRGLAALHGLYGRLRW